MIESSRRGRKPTLPDLECDDDDTVDNVNGEEGIMAGGCDGVEEEAENETVEVGKVGGEGRHGHHHPSSLFRRRVPTHGYGQRTRGTHSPTVNLEH